jgi:hypothetical protein
VMPEKIGKYHIIERIGRGGMGTIFKAHDPVLDRLVALKVISTAVEGSDERSVRFYREAQACARLSHPNIINVHGLDEDGGRLFIVMELLEGEELKHVIAQRKRMTLEDKLSVMVQVCDGVHYAHQNGVIHRDIKPGNIFLLRSGQVKILDFGVAKVSDAEDGLTRAGMIIGSPRYMSPEQVRGRVDQRSDLFSVGAVFYEFLSMRPPFTAADPVHLLEQIRTEEPPALDQLDPTIPPALAAVVARALRKDPAERFTDLEQMRSQLEEVQRGLIEEARGLIAHVREQRSQLLALRAALVERVGPVKEEEAVPGVDGRERLATAQALHGDFTARIEALRTSIAQADSLAPDLRRALELLQAGQFGEAVGAFEAVVAEMPQHGRALDGLEQARAHVERQRRWQLAAKLAQDARAALDDGSLTRCLEILERAAEIPAPAGTVEEIGSLRRAAEAAVAARLALGRARQEAEDARGRREQARRAARSQARPQDAPAPWNEAEVKSTEAAAALAREAYGEAREGFEVAITLYGRFAEAAREAQRREHEAAEQSRSQAAPAREDAQAEGARQYAAEHWRAAETKSSEAQSALDRQALGAALPPWPMRSRGATATRAVAEVGKPAPGSRWRLRRVAPGVGGLAVIGLGAFLWLARVPWTGPSPGPVVEQPRGVSATPPAAPVVGGNVPLAPSPAGTESAAGRPIASLPPVERAVDSSAVSPSSRMVDSPWTARGALQEVFEARNPAHSVTATVVKHTVRIGRDNLGFSISSSRPGYVYVMLARGNGSDVELLLPNTVDANNYIEPGQPLKLPGPRWPLKAQGPPGTNEFLAIVSDEPRDFSALDASAESLFKRLRPGGRPPDRSHSASPSPLAGTAACASATPCSQSYGAVVFSIDTVVGAHDARLAPPRPAATNALAARDRPAASPRCSGILERAALGDPLTDEEQTLLTRDCR